MEIAATYTWLVVAPPCLYIIWKYLSPRARPNRRLEVSNESDDPRASDPSLLRKHTSYKSITVPATGLTYPRIRIVHSPQPQAAQLPTLPLLVFIHGLGGSAAQFHPLLSSLVNLAPCLAIDLPGCGLSDFAPDSWDAYKTSSLVQLISTVVQRYLEEGQDTVLICHSMGCSLGALLTSDKSPIASDLSMRVKGLIALCPASKDISRQQARSLKRLLTVVKDPVFNLWRAWDRRGGIDSASVLRYTGVNAEPQLRRLQLRFNCQSRTPVFRRMAYGALPQFSTSDRVQDGAFLNKDIWAGVKVPVLIIAGKDDPVTRAEEAIAIASYLDIQATTDSCDNVVVGNVDPSESLMACSKLVILPSPASHALVYSPLTVRPVSNLIQNFLCSSIAKELSLGWQLQYLSTEGKWDVKNLRKWEAIEPVSKPIAGIFRAMKTLRQADQIHTPIQFAKNWARTSGLGLGADGQGAIGAIVDISHDSPVYDSSGLEQDGILYRKFPTVSKMPPTRSEVRGFIDAIDPLRQQLGIQAVHGKPTPVTGGSAPGVSTLIAVHCHYGFNRTGFFLISYLVEQLGWPLQDAIDEFAQNRPPGVRHAHFIDELWGRYWDFTDERSHV